VHIIRYQSSLGVAVSGVSGKCCHEQLAQKRKQWQSSEKSQRSELGLQEVLGPGKILSRAGCSGTQAEELLPALCYGLL
jgi:hypothetical protein